jgi:hypothetical protein
MSETFSPRRWATKLIIGAFLLMAGTGIAMFFELDGGLVVIVHQWSSWILLVGAVGHLITNFRSLKNHLKARWGAVTLGAFSVLLIVSWFSWGMITGPALKRPIEQALVDAPISALARVSQVDPATVAARLNALGIDARSEQSIRELAGQRNQDENRLLGLVFLADEPRTP